MIVLGMMSGTSVDSADGAIVEIKEHGEKLSVDLLFFGSYPYPETLRRKILDCMSPKNSNVRFICQLNFELGEFYGKAAIYFIERSRLKPDLIANHGQTIYHIPRKMARRGLIPSTLQIGEPSFIALMTGIPVVSDFRPADIAAGGEGAPLVPMADYILFHEYERSISVHNIGGISNLTYLPAHKGVDGIIAFDTGPGNTLIDSATQKLFGQPFDKDGKIAAKGKIHSGIMNELLKNPYFQLHPPKSTGREEFNLDNLPDSIWQLPPEDIVATLTAFTAETIALAYKKFVIPHGLDEILVGGGGAYNKTLMKMIKERLHPIPVRSLSSAGFNPKAREAVAFAILGYLSFNGLHGNVPSATGAKRQVVLGKITYSSGNHLVVRKSGG